DRRGHHQPDGAGRREFLDKVRERRGAGGLFPGELINGGCGAVINHAGVPVVHQPPHHVGAHAAESDHTELEWFFCHENCVPGLRFFWLISLLASTSASDSGGSNCSSSCHG